MIEVHFSKHTLPEDRATVLVDADKATVIEGSKNHSDDLLVLTKGNTEVAWFEGWSYAVKVDNLMEYVDEQ